MATTLKRIYGRKTVPFRIDKGVYEYLRKNGHVNKQLLDAFPDAWNFIPQAIPTNQLAIDFEATAVNNKSKRKTQK